MAALIRQYDGLLAAERCADIVARFEREPRKTRAPATLLLEAFPQWADVVEQMLAAVSAATLRYGADCPGFAATHARVQPASMVLARHDPQAATRWRAPATLRPRPIAAVLAFLTDSDAAIEFAEQPERLVPAAGTLAVFPADFTHTCRDTAGTSARYWVATALAFEVPLG